ncbi:MAG: DUF2336 domain-containing protein [Alphaproteobacteria bacterium]|nr:DUF2336 domain-containing protein [Alphaproteobacteria bacterium]
MKRTEPNAEEWTVSTVQRHAANKAVENGHVFSSVTKSLLGGEQGALSDRDRASLLQMLRQLIFDLTINLQTCLPIIAAEHDPDGTALKELSSERAAQVFDFLVNARSLNGCCAVEEAVMRLCIFNTEKELQSAARIDSAGSLSEKTENLCEVLGIAGNPSLSLLLERRRHGRGGYVDGFDNPLLCSKDLDPDIKIELIWLVAAALRHLIVDQLDATNSAVDGYIEKAAIEVIANSSTPKCSTPVVVVEALQEAGYLNPDALAAIFRNGDFLLFEAGIAQLTSVENRLIRRLVFETGGVGLAVLVRTVGLSMDDALHIYQVTNTSSRCIFMETASDPTSFQDVFLGISIEVANAVCAYWRRGRQFHNAVWELKTARNLLGSEG